MKKPRNSNIEWLRIISMFLIVVGHFYWQTNWNFSHTSLALKAGIEWLWMGGKLGVDLFVLISAYFLASRKTLKIKPLVKLWQQVFFYSVSLTLVAVFLLKIHTGLKIYIQTLLPVSTGIYWFVTAYVVMYLLAPYLNRGLDGLSKKEYRKLLLILGILFSIAAIFQTKSIGFKLDESPTIIALYPFGAYLRKYGEDLEQVTKQQLMVIGISATVLLYLSAFMIDFVLSMHGNIQNPNPHSFNRFYGSTSPLQLLLAVTIFAYALKRSPQTNQKVNFIAANVFGVYLFHCHPLIINWLWNDIIRGYRYQTTPMVFLYAIGCSLVIWCIGVVIDMVRSLIFKALRL